ncbi:hypothetical protein FQA39_LY13623 [Lamprigera yunnana]|nr:hypothetical protein FQA39_LY13623 [Lamprigera yunnana]
MESGQDMEEKACAVYGENVLAESDLLGLKWKGKEHSGRPAVTDDQQLKVKIGPRYTNDALVAREVNDALTVFLQSQRATLELSTKRKPGQSVTAPQESSSDTDVDIPHDETSTDQDTDHLHQKTKP